MAEFAGLPILSVDWSSSDVLQAQKKFKSLCKLYFSDAFKEKYEEKIPFLLIWSGEESREQPPLGCNQLKQKKQNREPTSDSPNTKFAP